MALGLTAAGYFVGQGISERSAGRRIISVKGLSEREVARIAAEQFSRDSQTTLGKLRNATQGWFQIENRDAATPERKVVRVVVDVEFEIN